MSLIATYIASEYPRSRDSSGVGLPDIWTPQNGACAGYWQDKFGLITRNNSDIGTPNNFSISRGAMSPAGVLLVWFGKDIGSSLTTLPVFGIWEGSTLYNTLSLVFGKRGAMQMVYRDSLGMPLTTLGFESAGSDNNVLAVGYCVRVGGFTYARTAVNGVLSESCISNGVTALGFTTPSISIGSLHADGYACNTITYATFAKEITTEPSETELRAMSSDLNVAFAYRDASIVRPTTRLFDSSLPLYTQVDDAPTCDTSDFIYTSDAGSATLQLSAVDDPSSSTGHELTYKARSDGSGDLTVTLQQGTGGGATTVATRTHTSVPGSWTDYTMTLTSGEADSITDYSDLHVKLDGTP